MHFNKGYGQISEGDYKILNAQKQEISFNDLVEGLSSGEIVLFGEYHDNAINHALQFATFQVLNESEKWAIGMEMLEMHQNRTLQEYMHGSMSWVTWKNNEKLWPNFETDYLPMAAWAKENRIPLVATNVPRYLASIIAKEGWEGIDKEIENNPKVKEYLPPLPLEVDENAPGYRDFPAMFGGNNHGFDIKRFIEAQAVKDARMAYSIITFMRNNPSYKMFHIQGNFHNQDRGGIYWYLKHYQSKKNILTVDIYLAKTEDLEVEIDTDADYYIVIKE